MPFTKVQTDWPLNKEKVRYLPSVFEIKNNMAQITDQPVRLDDIESAIEAIRKGEVIIVVDDEDRENEGDMICAAEMVTPEIVNFMSKEARGLICASISEERCEELGLDMMVGRTRRCMPRLSRFLLICWAKVTPRASLPSIGPER